ncbi:MAG: hypothetical protein ACTMIH_10825 [Microbacterium gubbeenense]|uniref:hypothetical protein n=1 Tax=Microbacterium gubbeenense TaxID=159896 RepID=UPI003F9D7F69
MTGIEKFATIEWIGVVRNGGSNAATSMSSKLPPYDRDMPSKEFEALARAHRPWSRMLWAMVAVVGLIAIGIGLVEAREPGTIDHLLGQSSEQTATVTGFEEVPWCDRNNRDRYTIAWEQDGVARTGDIRVCGEPWAIGDQVRIWSTSAGEPSKSSPLTMRVVTGLLVVGLAVTTAMFWRARRRVRRAAAAALDNTWQPRTIPTTGRPDEPNFRFLSPDPPRNRKRDWQRIIFSAKSNVRSDANVRGRLFIDEVRSGRLRGLSLHGTDDGDRVWRWHG